MMFCPQCKMDLLHIPVGTACPRCGSARRAATALPPTMVSIGEVFPMEVEPPGEPDWWQKHILIALADASLMRHRALSVPREDVEIELTDRAWWRVAELGYTTHGCQVLFED